MYLLFLYSCVLVHLLLFLFFSLAHKSRSYFNRMVCMCVKVCVCVCVYVVEWSGVEWGEDFVKGNPMNKKLGNKSVRIHTNTHTKRERERERERAIEIIEKTNCALFSPPLSSISQNY